MVYLLILPFLLFFIILILQQKQSTINQWRHVFWVSFIILITTAFIYVMYGVADKQPWNEKAANKRNKEVDDELGKVA